MLKSLSINNFAVILNATIEFEEGLNILTGETGAGKSIVIDAINMILGNRISKSIIRTGESKAKVEAIFELDDKLKTILSELGIDYCEEDDLLLQREISVDGKSSVRINGKLSTVTILKLIATNLIDIHGQHDSQMLMSNENHIKMLDDYGKIHQLVIDYQSVLQTVNHLKKEINKYNIDTEEKERQLSILTHEISEIEDVNLKDGEYEELLKSRDIWKNYEHIIMGVNNSYEELFESNDYRTALELISSALKHLDGVSDYDAKLQGTKEKLSNALYSIEDVCEELRGYKNSMEFEENDIDSIEIRLDSINHLRRKFGNSYEEIQSYYEKAKNDLESITFIDEKIEKLTLQYEAELKNLKNVGAKLTEIRMRKAKELEKIIIDELSDLNMPNTRFEIHFYEEQEKFYTNGMDKVEFLISTNLGQELGKLSKIASGGELSRVMLAIKSALFKTEDVGTLIFDEIDTGVSGRAAQKISEKLFKVSKNTQVLCVTHLAQIATMADNHYLIEKNISENKTLTAIYKLSNIDRVAEIARIIGGIEISDATVESARDMLNQAYCYKKNGENK